MIRIHDFAEKLAYSGGVRERLDTATIKQMITGCVDVEKTNREMDRRGVDYVAHLRGGAEILIDAKTRTPGCHQYWSGEPEVALEIWSVKPGGKYNIPKSRQKPGWTVSENTDVNLIFYSFPPDATDQVYLLSFQLLRLAFRRFFRDWNAVFKVATQDSGSWESEAMFVPASVVLGAITQVSQGRLEQITDDTVIFQQDESFSFEYRQSQLWIESGNL